MNGTNNGNRPEDMRSIAEEERTDSRDNGRQERTIGEIISDATDEELKHYHTGTLTPEELRSAVDKEQRAGRRRMLRRLTAAAALLMLVVAATVFAFENFTTDVDADKNAKEEIVTEDGVVIEDGGWGSDSEQSWEITDWDEVATMQEVIPKLMIPEYIPKEYSFRRLLISSVGNIQTIEYLFMGKHELVIQEQIYNENLESTEIYDADKKIESAKGIIYINNDLEINNATIQIDEGIIIYVWTNLSDAEVKKIIEGIEF